MKYLLALFLALVLSLSARAQATPEPEPLAEPLQALLEAAAAEPDPQRFEDAIELLALTQSPVAIAAGAEALSPERGATARSVLGLAEPEARAETQPAPTAPPSDQSEDRGWRALPMQAVDAIASGQSQLWTGQVRLGFRQDSGNSDRLDYLAALSVERDLAVWGFEAGIDYAYAESDGAVGADTLTANAQVDRETGDRWSIFTGVLYEQDALSGFDYTGVLDVGLAYRALTGDIRTLTLEAGPAVRFIQPVNGDLRTEAASEFSADLDWQLSDTLVFQSDTQLLVTSQSRLEQIFALQTSLGELWALQLSYRYRNEFDPEPGFEAVDTRTDISIVRTF
jgi:putative salt-induced outer membrane protein YdiY